MDFATFLLYLVLRRSVMVLIFSGFIVFALARWKKHPRVSLLTVSALVIYIIDSFFFAIIFHLLPSYFASWHMTDQGITILDDVLNIVDAFVFSVVLILLVSAAFYGRRSATAINA